MPIYPNSKFIAVNHPVLGKGELPGRIGPMSTELAMWLRFRLDWQKAKDSGEFDKVDSIDSRFFKNQDTHEWHMRSMVSAFRSYKPALCSIDGQLTELGRTTAELVLELIRETASITTKDATTFKSDQWTKTEQVFVMGAITIRQAAMLKMIALACADAERTQREELDEEFSSWQSIERKDEEFKAQSGAKAIQELRKQGDNTHEAYLDVLFERELHNDPQSFQARLIGGYGQERKAFVPTAIFGQRARNDMANLLKYGLLDLKALSSGMRGRPKHIVRTSPTGLVVVNDLTENERLI